VIADAFPLCATRRGFDIKSNHRRSVCFRINSQCSSDLHASFDCPRRDRDHDCPSGLGKRLTKIRRTVELVTLCADYMKRPEILFGCDLWTTQLATTGFFAVSCLVPWLARFMQNLIAYEKHQSNSNCGGEASKA